MKIEQLKKIIKEEYQLIQLEEAGIPGLDAWITGLNDPDAPFNQPDAEPEYYDFWEDENWADTFDYMLGDCEDWLPSNIFDKYKEEIRELLGNLIDSKYSKIWGDKQGRIDREFLLSDIKKYTSQLAEDLKKSWEEYKTQHNIQELKGLDAHIMGLHHPNAPFNKEDWTEKFVPVLDASEWLTDDELDSNYDEIGNIMFEIFEEYKEKYSNVPYTKQSSYEYALMKKFAKEMSDELLQRWTAYKTKHNITEDRFDNSLYIKPSNAKRIGWLVISAKKNDGRPIYKLYDDDDPKWGATYRLGAGKYPENDKLFYTIPIKIEPNNRFRILGAEDENWSRPYKYDNLELEKNIDELRDFRTETPEVFRKYHPENAVWFQNDGNLFGSVSNLGDKFKYIVTNKYGTDKEEGYEPTLELVKQKVLNKLNQ